MRVNRNAIRIVVIVLITASLISCSLYHSPYGTDSFAISYLIDFLQGLISGCIVSITLAVLNYINEKNAAFENYYRCLQRLVSTASNYRQDIKEASELLDIVDPLVQEQLNDLGDAFSRFSFLLDNPIRPLKMRSFLYSLYVYFVDIKHMTRDCRYHLRTGSLFVDDKDFMDSIFLRIKQDDLGRIISNRIVEDYDREFTILLKCCNGIHIPSRDLEFSKSVITEKSFIVVSKDEEELLNKLNKRVVKSDSGFRQIANVEDIQDADWELLFDKGYISAIHESTVDSKIIAVEVSDKAFYYFDYKSRYHPENTNSNNGEN